MKRTILLLIVAIMALPAFSQKLTTPKKKKHIPATAFLHQQTTRFDFDEEEELNLDIWDAGAIIIKNNAKARNIKLFEADNSGSWNLLANETPVYHEDGFIIKELVSWYEDPNSDQIFGEKKLASYDEEGNLTRLEVYYFEDEQWIPYEAMEFINDEFGQVSFYAEYEHDGDDWEMTYGYRANDQFENNLLTVRIWEEFDSMEDWFPVSKEEFVYNEDDIQVGITEYIYDAFDQTWEKSNHQTYQLDDNNTWISGYSYLWDEYENEWLHLFSYHDMQWNNFDLLQIASVTVMINASIFEDKNTTDAQWINFMKISGEYTSNDLMTLIMTEYWDDEWVPFAKEERNYDHHQNLIVNISSYFNDGEWEMTEGYKVEITYNEDQSVKTVELLNVDYGTGKLEPVYYFEYYYQEDATSTPVVNLPQELKIYPNPASSVLNMVWAGSDGLLDITIITPDGKVLSYEQQYALNGQVLMMDISNLSNGVYFIRCQGKSDQRIARFIKN